MYPDNGHSWQQCGEKNAKKDIDILPDSASTPGANRGTKQLKMLVFQCTRYLYVAGDTAFINFTFGIVLSSDRQSTSLAGRRLTLFSLSIPTLYHLGSGYFNARPFKDQTYRTTSRVLITDSGIRSKSLSQARKKL